VGRDSSVGIATRYGLDGPRIETRWGRDFPHPSRPALGPTPASYTMGTGSFPGVKRPGGGVDHSPLPSAKVKERVEPYVSPFGPSWPVLGRGIGYLVKSTNIHLLILQVFYALSYFLLGPNIHRIAYLQKFQCVLFVWDETVALTATLPLDNDYRLF